MSVILKSSEEISHITSGLLYHYELYWDLVENSTVYKKAELKYGNECENLEPVFVCWLMFRVWVANKIAYSIQYGAQVTLHEGLPDITPDDIDLSYLASELSNLDYNIYTNGGQYWLDREWHDLYLQIMNRIKESVGAVCVGGVQ